MHLKFKVFLWTVFSLVLLSVFPSISFSKNNLFCGPDVLSTVYRYLGMQSSLKPLEDIAGRQYGMTSFADLMDHAEKNKLRTLAFKQGNIDILKAAMQKGFVVINNRGHFSLIEKIDDKVVHIYTPGYQGEHYAMSFDIFRTHWDGYGLIIGKKKIKLSKKHGNFLKLSRAESGGVLGANPCQNCSGSGSLALGTTLGNNAPTVAAESVSANAVAATTTEPVYLQNGDLYQTVNDMTIPARGLPLVLNRYYNSQVVSDVDGWMMEPGGGSWTIENGEYSGEGDRSYSKNMWNDVTIELDMQTIQPGPSFAWEAGWINFRYFDADNRYYLIIRTDGILELAKRQNLSPNDPPVILAQITSTLNPLNMNHVKIDAIGNNIQVRVNGTLYINHTDPTPLTGNGRMALESHFSHAHFDNLAISDGINNKLYDFAQDDNDFIFGYGWSHSYSMRIKEYADHTTVIHDNNARHVYQSIGSGNYQPVIFNTYDTLTKDANGFNFTTKHKKIYRFDLSGRLQYIEDRNGNRTTLSYSNISGSLKLTSIQSDGTRDITLSYGANNMVEYATDPAGQQIHYTYDPAGHLTGVTDRENHSVAYGYDPVNHNMTSYTDKDNNSPVIYTYAYNDRVLTQTDPYGNITTFDYNWDTTHVMNDKGEQYKYNFDTNVFLQAVEDPNNIAESMTNNANGDRTDHWDRNNNHTQYVYNAAGDMTKLTDDKGNTHKWTTYNSFHFPLTYENARGYTTSYTYDAKGNLTTIIDALTHVITFVYTAHGEVDSIMDDKNNTTDFIYNTEGDMIEKIAPGNRHTYYGYNNLGQLTSVTNALNKITVFTYDGNGRLETVTDPLLRLTTFIYSPNGRLTQVTDPLLHQTNYTYDAFGNVQTVTDANGNAVNQTYDLDNQMHLATANLTQLDDQNFNPAIFSYDPMDRLTQSTDAQGQGHLYAYDQQGNLITRTDATGQVTQYAYDELNRFVSLDYNNDGSLETWFVLDENGNKTEIHDNLGATLVTYDALDRPTQIVRPDGYTVGYEYDTVGNRTKVTYPSGLVVEYFYTINNEIFRIDRDGKLLAFYNYDKLGRVTRKRQYAGHTSASVPGSPIVFRELEDGSWEVESEDLPDSPDSPDGPGGGGAIDINATRVDVSYIYDAANQLLTLKHGVNATNYFTYTYDNAGNRDSVTGLNGNYQYTYDSIYQLTHVAGSSTHNYTYDPAGNRDVADGLTYAADNLNQYVNAGPFNYLHDPNGNMTFDGSTTYTYDEENRPFMATRFGMTAHYTYDGLGRRIRKDINGVITKYIYDGDRIIAEYDGSGALQSEYIYGIGIDEVITMDRGTIRYHYLYDGLGSVVRLIDNDTIAAVETYSYDPYGQPLNTSTVGNPYMFTGREYDSETGLYNYRARMYHPVIGRFMQRDPIGHLDNVNLYTYVRNNPINWVDPYGLEAVNWHTGRNKYNFIPYYEPVWNGDVYIDKFGNVWIKDNISSIAYHNNFNTYRGTGSLAGSQAVYADQIVVNSGIYTGTYDYYPPFNDNGDLNYINYVFHIFFDIIPHYFDSKHYSNSTLLRQ